MNMHPAFDLDWNLVRSFVAVARAGSLAGGARALGITHPTIARHVQQLEEQLGFALFSRTGQGLQLNEPGAKLKDAAEHMHDSALAFQSVTDRVRDNPVGRLRLGVSEVFAELLPDVIMAEFFARESSACDGVALDLVVNNELLNLLRREADMALRHVQPDQQELLCKRVGALRLGLFASEAYVARHGELTRDNAAQHRFIDGLNRAYLVEGAAAQGMHLTSGQLAFRSDSVACRRAAVRSGWGVAALPLWMAGQERGWIQVFTDMEPVELPVWLVARPEVRDNRHLRQMFTGLGAALQSALS